LYIPQVRGLGLRSAVYITLDGMPHPAAHLLVQRDYPGQLLEAASEMLERGRYEASAVIAQMACETCAERVFRAYFGGRGVSFLEEAVDDLLPSYNLASEKVRTLYVALTGDPIQQQFFWAEYKVIVTLRNKAVHAGSRIQESQAQMVLRVAKLVVKHLQSIEQRAPKPSEEPGDAV
jgi:hypothetical protein